MISPKEKALKLAEEFYEGSDNFKFCEAREFAKICVNEILEAIDWNGYETLNDEYVYWIEVLKEIEKL
jgi:hypothetical protein